MPTMEADATLTCDVCGLEHQKVALPPGRKALCTRCGTLLAVGSAAGRDGPLCFAIAGLALAIPSLALPFIGAEKLGDSRTSYLLTGVRTLWREQMYLLSVIVFFCGAIFPVALLTSQVLIYLPDRFGSDPPWRKPLGKALEVMRQWSIPEVQVLATLVALMKLGDLVTVHIGRGFWTYCAMTLCLLIANYGFDYSVAAPEPPETEEAKTKTRGRWRQSLAFRSRQSSMALGLAAAVLLYPANFLPVLDSFTAGKERIDTIYTGAMSLGEQGLWILTAIVLLASIVIPVLKLIGLAVLLASTRPGRPPSNPRRLTRIYAALAFIGRWSMLDVFLAGLLAGLVRFGEVGLMLPMPGIIAFCVVVILTVLATESFDPQQIWKSNPPLAEP